jgi:hypothetical protein
LLFPALVFAQAAAPEAKPEASTASAGNFPVMSSAAKGRLRQLYGYFESGQSSQFYAAFSPELKKVRSAATLTTTMKSVLGQLGREDKLLGENFAPELGTKTTVYARFSQFTKSINPVFTVLVIDPQGQIVVFQPRPVPTQPGNRFSDYKVQTRLKLPFTGDWFVYQGGTAIYQNVDAYRDAERYTMSFLMLKDGQSFSGDGTKNEQYYCYGQPLVAPADGKVMQVNNGFADNPPGHPSDVGPIGNRLIIYHGHSEYSLFMHLKQNSIKVKSGDKVKQGDVVAECGNSGNSAYPHFEYRLQNSSGRPFPFTLPAQFVDYIADGKAVEAGQPVRGEFVKAGGGGTTTAEK